MLSLDRKKVLELDKICRVCICERRDMRPLYSDRNAEMLMEFANVRIEQSEGWPDKICVQCVHSVSRCHAFKNLVERCDKKLRDYMKDLMNQCESNGNQDETQQEQQAHLQEFKFDNNQFKIIHLQQSKQVLPHQQQDIHQSAQQTSVTTTAKAQKVSIQRLKQQPQTQSQSDLQTQFIQVSQTPQAHPLSSVTQQKSKSINRKGGQRQCKKQITVPHKQQQPQLQQVQTHQQQYQQHHHAFPSDSVVVVTSNNVLTRHHQHQPQTTQLQAQPQQQPLQASQLLSTAAALPQQIVMPNGQIITTAQIVTHTGAPQIAQIITNPVSASTSVSAQPPPLQHFATPQLIQTTSGQTLQLIQQPNGHQTLQLVQLVPQRNLAPAVMDETNLVDDTVLIDESDRQQMLEESCETEDDPHDEQEQICETIVVEEEQLQSQHHLYTTTSQGRKFDDNSYSQGEAQELEYLEDITVTTTTNSVSHQHQAISMQDENDSNQAHLLHPDEEELIEEIQLEEEEEMLEDVPDDSGGHVIQVMDANNEFITEEEHHHQLNQDYEHLEYTVMETQSEGGAELVEEVLAHKPQNATSKTAIAFVETNNESAKQQVQNKPTTTRKTRRSASAKAVANSRQLASSIASAVGGDEDFEIDSTFLAEFISHQTTSLGGGRYICNLCRTEFKQFKALHNHMPQHANWIRANCKKQPQCEICFKTFKGPGMLKMHMKTHQASMKTPTCNICNKEFKSKAILYRHRQSHIQRSFSCGVDNCRKIFSSTNTLRSHTERKHSDANTTSLRFTCRECNTLFSDVDVLESHVQLTGHGNGGGGNSTADDLISETITTQVGNVIVVTQS